MNIRISIYRFETNLSYRNKQQAKDAFYCFTIVDVVC